MTYPIRELAVALFIYLFIYLFICLFIHLLIIFCYYHYHLFTCLRLFVNDMDVNQCFRLFSSIYVEQS